MSDVVQTEVRDSDYESTRKARREWRFVHMETTRHGKLAVYFRRGKGPRIRLPDDTKSPEFRTAYAAAFNQRPLPHVKKMPGADPRDKVPRIRAYLVSALGRSRTRAADRHWPFDLSLPFLLEMARKQNNRCALTGIEFFSPSNTAAHADPFAPSIDRIDARKGYTEENVRLVIYAMNTMLLDWGEPLFEQVVNAYRYRKYAATRA